MSAVLALALAQAASPAPVRADPQARDLATLVRLFEGRFDNDLQVWRQADPRAGVPAERRHARLHAVHRRLPDTAFGAPAFHVREHRDDDPAKVVRQRVVWFESDPGRGDLVMRIRFLKDPAAFEDAGASALARLGPADVTEAPGCDVRFRRRGDVFIGAMEPKACVFGEGADRRYSVHDVWLGETAYWRVDRTFRLSDGTLFAGHPDDAPHEMVRARPFSCTVGLPAKSYAEPDPADISVTRDDLHDGGAIMRVTRPADGKVWQIQLRRQAYAFRADTGGDFLLLRVREEGARTSAGLATADADASSISINLGWLTANCRTVAASSMGGRP